MPNDVVFSAHQPNFLPYMGFFYKMFQSDVFVLLDDVQYSNMAYHNTNFIKIGSNKYRITVPVNYNFGEKINEVRICYAKDWVSKLLKTIEQNYGKTPYFEESYNLLVKHLNMRYEYLAELNISLIREIASAFQFKCRIAISSADAQTTLKRQERLIAQCHMLNGTIYYSGVGGKEYNDEESFLANGIRLVYSDYKPIHYEQRGKGFIENLSVFDYICNQGFRIPEEWARKT